MLADEVAQLWRATGDHHDSFSHTLEQLAAIKGKSSWSGPYGWAYSKRSAFAKVTATAAIAAATFESRPIERVQQQFITFKR